MQSLESLPMCEAVFIEPMECLAVATLPEGADWIYEVKLDGYRAVAINLKGELSLVSRKRKSFDRQYPYIVEALSDLPKNTVVESSAIEFKSGLTTMPTCIYCRCCGQEFDREHVIPDAFGTFEPLSFILYDSVCKDCNNYFGRTLDFALSRDSTEAMLRFRYGTKPAKEAGDLPYKKLELKIGQPGPWFGATVVLQADKTGKAVEPVPVPQAAFRWKGSQDWNYLVEQKLEPATLAQYVNPTPGTLEIRVMGPSTEDHERVLTKLTSAGIKFRQEGTLMQPVTEDGKVLVEIAAAVDQTIFRAIAKIAFNYVTHQHGADFVLRSDFDEIRDYIRYGTEPRWAARMPVVFPVADPILYDDARQLRQTNGHIITFDWQPGQMGFMGQVSLFNTITYRVRICPSYRGIWHLDFRRGHHFNIEDRTIETLFSSPLAVSLIR
jgi:hypothetical protein